MNGTAHRRGHGSESRGASETGRAFFVCPAGGRGRASSRGRATEMRRHARRAADRELAHRFRSLVEQMQVGIAIVRLRPLRFLFANRAFLRMSGYRARELTSLGPKEAARCFHPEDRAAVLDYLGKRIAGREASLLNGWRIVRKDGGICHAEISSRSVRYEGRPAVQATFIDWTRRWANERRLQLLSQAAEQVEEGVGVIDLHGKIVYANPAVAVMHGRAPGSLAGKPCAVLHSRKQIAAVRAAFAQARSTGRYSGELWHARRDGTAFPCFVQTTVLRDEKGGEIGFVASCRDITDAKNAADELARLREEKALILDSISESISYNDRRSRIVWANLAAARRAGMMPRDLLGRRCYEVWHGRGRPCPRCPALVAIRTGKPAWGESAVRDGRRHLVGVFPVRDSEGRISGSVVVAIEAGTEVGAEELHNLRSFSKMLIDLQEEERKRMALELHDQVGQRLAALRFHLRRIGERCAEGDCAAPAEFTEAYALIDATLGDVRAISRRLRPPTLDILGLVPSLSQLVESLSLQSGIPVRLRSRNVRGKMDARIEIALYRVAQEALTNALRYSECTRIDISLRKIRRTLTLRIVDDGKGFGPLRANRVTGLGLTEMRERIEGVGGSFAVRSVPAAGTRIEARVPLPLCAPRARRKGGSG